MTQPYAAGSLYSTVEDLYRWDQSFYTDKVLSAALLARAHRANGDRIEAVRNFSRAIELGDTPRAFLIYTDAIRELATLETKVVK